MQSIVVLCICSFVATAQGELDTEQKIVFRNEQSLSIGIHSYGIEFSGRYAMHVTRLEKQFYEFQIASLHHPKEVKLNTPTGRSVYGKLNNASGVSFLYGKQHEKYSKLDKNSVAISYVYSAGVSVGIEKPMYYYIRYPDVIERFNASNHTKLGKAPFYYGISEIRLIPGIILESSVQFEFSRRDIDVKAFEFGMHTQLFLRKVEIMYTSENTWIFPSLFVSYRLGRVVRMK